jgi:hypothetical protein
MVGEGKTILPEPAPELGIREQTDHRSRSQHGGMKADDAKALGGNW